jgi:hypothetical protein
MRKEDEFYDIKDNDRDEVQRIHIDKSTKSDKVITGDTVKANVTEQGIRQRYSVQTESILYYVGKTMRRFT